MKNNWQIKKLGEICDFEGGSQPPKSNFIYTQKKGYVRFLQIRDFKSEKNITYIPESKKNRICNKNDILIGRYGASVGQILTGEEGAYNVALMKATPNLNLINRDFFYHYLISSEFQDRLSKVSARSAQAGFSKEDIYNFPVITPPLIEQKRIVKILDEAFEKIEKAKENTEINLINSKELFESYLQNIFANPGKDWQVKELGDVCSLYQGIAINTKTRHALVEKSDLPLLRIKDLKNNTVEQYIDPNNYPINALVNESDIIYTRTGSLGLVFRGKRGVLHNNSFKIVPNHELTKDYLFIWLQNPIFKSKILSLAMRAAQPDITHAIFKIQKIEIPPIKEQKIIVKKLDELSEQTKKLELIYQKKLDNLEELKKSILSKAFSGEL
jgi:type I restriction enzyme S subunit